MFEIIEDEHTEGAMIKVVGVGGGGGNAVNYMIEKGLSGVEFIVMNTDAQALKNSQAAMRLQLGEQITKGLGAGANPEVGYQSALENKAEIKTMIEGADILFIAVGMGGGTGTGASPVVAEIAKELGILTIGVVSKPSFFEGKKRTNYALQGIKQLNLSVDALITIPNDKLQKALPKGISFLDALKASNDVLYNAVLGFSSIINDDQGLINLDFSDIRTVMQEIGTTAMMGMGVASGDDRVNKAVEQAIVCPLLEDVDLNNATAILANITMSRDFTYDEYIEAGTAIRAFSADDAQIIIGVTIDPDCDKEALKVTVVVTGLDAHKEGEKKMITATEVTPEIPAKVEKPKVKEKIEEKTFEIESTPQHLDIPTFLRRKD